MDIKHYDPRDPVFHDLEGDDAVAKIVKRHQSWRVMQTSEIQARYCDHGRYVGYNQALAYRCPGCVEEDKQ